MPRKDQQARGITISVPFTLTGLMYVHMYLCAETVSQQYILTKCIIPAEMTHVATHDVYYVVLTRFAKRAEKIELFA